MAFDLVSQVIQYLGAVEKYVDFLELYLELDAYDQFDQAYSQFFASFRDFVWTSYAQPESALKLLMDDYGEFEVPLDKSMIQYCLDGLQSRFDAQERYREGQAASRLQIYTLYLLSRFGQDETAFLVELNEKQWEAFEKMVFQCDDLSALKDMIGQLT